MQAHITVITLAVADLQRALNFYEKGLGLPTNGIIGAELEHGSVAFIDLQGGLKLALWPQTSLAHDTGLAVTPICQTSMSIGHNVESPKQVDQLMAQALAAGATLIKPAQDTFWGGYGGYFADPDQHLWEVVWNPHLQAL